MTLLFLITHFTLGFLTSFIGTLPPGAINLEVLRLSLYSNTKTVLLFIGATMFAELIYTTIAVLFSSYLASIPKLEHYIQLLSIPVFIIIGLSYLFMTQKVEDNDNRMPPKSKNIVLKGLSLGFFNPLQVPFWITYTTYFLSVGWILNQSAILLVFIAGALAGSFSMLFLIYTFGSYYNKKFTLTMTKVNKGLAVLFFLLAGLQGFNVWKVGW